MALETEVVVSMEEVHQAQGVEAMEAAEKVDEMELVAWGSVVAAAMDPVMEEDATVAAATAAEVMAAEVSTAAEVSAAAMVAVAMVAAELAEAG